MNAHAAEMEPSRHKCLIYDGHPSEQLPVVLPLLMDGLQENWRCLYLGNPETVQMVDSALATRGVDTARETKRGALVLSSDRSHLDGGKFDPRAMVDALCAFIDDAVRDGYEGLCATGDMKWELGADENFERLLEYEARLEQVFRDRPLRGICQYHRDLLPSRAVRDALLTHRSTYVGDALNRDNLFYIPPELLLEAPTPSSASKQGEWMYQQITRILSAERTRDKALEALRESESQQRHLAEELAELNRGLERRVAERTADLEIANRHLESFSYSISHDLRAPLRSISRFSEILAEDSSSRLDADGLQHLTRIRSNAKLMGELIEGLLKLGQTSRKKLQVEEIDLSALSTEVADEVRHGTPERTAEFVIAEGMRAKGDRTLVRAALTNLVSNAWKFTSKRAGARIEIGRAGDDGRQPIFFVADNGAGFDMDHASKLFGVFQRLHRQNEFPGTGIGLSTVQRIVAKHGGRIWAEGRVDQGATFFFTLPGVEA